jgi:hypothetical protein
MVASYSEDIFFVASEYPRVYPTLGIDRTPIVGFA